MLQKLQQLEKPQTPAKTLKGIEEPTTGERILCVVLIVIDGDTFKCKNFLDGKEETIRLIGIDTPESSDNEKARRDSERTGQDLQTIIALGKKAEEFTRSYLPEGTVVELELDVQSKDKYGRTLAYVYLPDKKMLNALLIQEGYAQIMTIPPNVKYQDLFLKLQREAREQGKGLWGKD